MPLDRPTMYTPPPLGRGDLSGLEEAIGRLEGLSARPAIQFVDCGFVRQQVARLRPELEPRDVRINTFWMSQQGATIKPLRLLRSYLYDGAFPPDHARYADQHAEHKRLADSTAVQLRLGTVRGEGDRERQKGVDTLIVLDMLVLAQQGAYDTAVLWTGDADFAEVVDQVQRLGRQVALVTPEGGHVADQLRQTCDIVLEMKDSWWRNMHDPQP